MPGGEYAQILGCGNNTLDSTWQAMDFKVSSFHSLLQQELILLKTVL